jgi:hypothetical protein
MSGKAKSVYLTVAKKTTHESVFKKVFFKAADLNEYVKTEEFKQKYPDTEFYWVKEIY